MKFVLAFIALCTFSTAIPCLAGNGARGGDTDAIEFVAYALKIGQWLQSSARPELKPAAFMAYAQMLAKNLDGNEKSKLEFLDRELTDKFGIPKMAVFTTPDQPIQIERKTWVNFTEEEKYRLVSVEIFGQIGVKERYARAYDVAAHYKEMESINRYELQKALEDFAHFKPVQISVAASGGQSNVLDTFGFHFINEQVKQQSLNSNQPGDILKLARLFSQPKYICESQILLAVHRIVVSDPEKLEEIIERRHQNDLRNVEMMRQSKAEVEAKGLKWYGDTPTPTPVSAFSAIYISLDTEYSEQIHDFLLKWEQAKSTSEKEALRDSLKVDIFKEQSRGIQVNQALYSSRRTFSAHEISSDTGQVQDLRVPFHWGFNDPADFYYSQYVKALVKVGFQSAEEEEERCTMTGAQLAYAMGMGSADVEEGFRPQDVFLNENSL